MKGSISKNSVFFRGLLNALFLAYAGWNKRPPFFDSEKVFSESNSVLPELGKIVVENTVFSKTQDEKGIKKGNSSLKEVYLSIWQPPKLS